MGPGAGNTVTELSLEAQDLSHVLVHTVNKQKKKNKKNQGLAEGHPNLSSTHEGSSKTDTRASCRAVLVTRSLSWGRVQLRGATRGKARGDFSLHIPISMHNTVVLLLVANTRATRQQRQQREEKRKRRRQRGSGIRG